MKRTTLVIGLFVAAIFALSTMTSEVLAHEYEFDVKNQCNQENTVTLFFTCDSEITLTLSPGQQVTLVLTTNCQVRLAVVRGVEIEPGECVQGNACAAALRPASFTFKPSCN